MGVAALAALAGCGPTERVPGPGAPGVVDLRTAPANAVVRLRHGWLVRPAAPGAPPTTFAVPPGPWRPVRVEQAFVDQGLPDEGGAWYRTRLRLPPGVRFTGRLVYASNAYRLYATTPDGRTTLRAASSARPGTPAEPSRSRRLAHFTLPLDTAVVLTWEVYNRGYVGGGPYYAPVVGPETAMDAHRAWNAAVVFGTVGVYLTLFLCFGLLWLRQRTNLQALVVGLIGVVLSLRTLTTTGMLDVLVPTLPFALHVTLEGLSFFLLLGIGSLMLWTLLPQEFAPLPLGRRWVHPPLYLPPGEDLSATLRPAPRWLRQAHTALATVGVAAGAGLSLLALFAGPRETSLLYGPGRVVGGLVLGLALSTGVSALVHRRPYTGRVAAGLLLLVATGAHDLLVGYDRLPGRPFLLPFAFMAFLVLVSATIAARVAAFGRSTAEDNRTLAHRVAQRTRELRAATIAAQAASLAKTQFLTSISHELRTPLASMLGYTQLLRDELAGKASAEHLDFLRVIERSGDRLLALINDLLDLSKIEAGRFDLDLAPTPLLPVLRDVVDALYPLAAAKGLALTLDADLPGDTAVLADPARLQQVFINLVSNGVKFTDTGRVRLAVRPGVVPDTVAVDVVDTGAGITAGFLPHLFERFTQDARLYGRTQQGTGLGLAITRELVLRMEGTISVTSDEGKGSTFTVTLRRAPRPGPSEPPAALGPP